MFDLSIPPSIQSPFDAELPDLGDDWRIGAIVGPSGSGKSTLARAAFGTAVSRDRPWPARKAIVDCFDRLDVRAITSMLTAVGFSSPPAWIRPYATLSNGEQFRANLARALLVGGPLVVYDEYSSVVDRTVAQIGSAAVAKSIRKRLVACRFVAVSCHYDILPWLQPDWVLDTSDYSLRRRRLRRPPIRLEICRCLPDAWRIFRRHHYLSARLSSIAVRCFLGLVRARPVAFAAILPCPGLPRARRISRLVVLPDWQGVGIGRAFCGLLGATYADAGLRLHIRTSHAAMIACLRRDARWRVGAVYRYGSSPAGGERGETVTCAPKAHHVSRRPGVSFVYEGASSRSARRRRPRARPSKDPAARI
jgi:GNAT superfamily N-acetyltransferase